MNSFRRKDGDGEEGGVEMPAEPDLAPAELVHPGELLRGNVNLIAKAPDKRSTQMIFEIASAGAADWYALGTARAPFHLHVDTRRILDGSYEFRIESRSVKGRSSYSERFGPFVIDNTPPSVSITSPRDGEIIQNAVEFVASVSDDVSGVGRVELTYTEEGEWHELGQLEPSGDEVRGVWLVEHCAPGECRLRARAFDRAGNEASHVITVEIARPPEPELEPELEPEPEQSEPQAPTPPRIPPVPSSEAVRRFGDIPGWDWKKPASTETKTQLASEPLAKAKPEPTPAPRPSPEVEPNPPDGGVAWTWKSPAPESPLPSPEHEIEPGQTSEDEAPSPAPPPVADERDTEPAATEEEGGELVSFPLGARGWNLWELSELVEEAPDQNPIEREERRQVLYHLREHTGMDGRIPQEFDDLISDVFRSLLEGEQRD